MAQEPEEAEAPTACSGQEEKMQEEETTVMKTKRPIEDEETEAKKPRVEAEPKKTTNSDIDMDDELNKLKIQNWNFMGMVKDCDFRREKDRQRFMRELEELQPHAVFGGANRSTPNVVMNFMTVVYKKQVEEVHKDGDHEDMDAKLQEAWDDVSGAALDPKEDG